MKKLLIVLIALTIVGSVAESADARWRLFRRWRGYGGGSYSQTGYNTSLNGTHKTDEYTQGVAQYRANEMARMNRWGHFWAGFGNGFAEGVGSGATPDQAKSNCCDFNGYIIGQGVAQSASGTWFACTIYGN